MKTQEDIDREVETTLEIASGISAVTPPLGLKGRIMERINGPMEVETIPFYRRTGFAAAAAVLILALNVVTVIYYTRKSATSIETSVQADPITDIHSAYFSDESDF